jgi:signal transduction histidine kinase
METKKIKLKNISLTEADILKKRPVKRKKVSISNREIKNLGKYFVEYAPFGILTLNKEGYIDFCSSKVVNFTGVKKLSDLIGIHAPSIPTYKKIGLSDYLNEAYKGSAFQSQPVRYFSYFGNIESIRKFTIIPLKNSWGDIKRLLLIIEDAEKEQKEKLALERKKRELKRLVDLRTIELQNKVKELEKSKLATMDAMSELNTAYSKLKKLDKIKSDFIDVVSHQLRTPLTSIRWNLEMILTGSLGKINNTKQKQSLDYIFTGIMTLIDNLEDMIAVSSFESKEDIKLNPVKVSLKELFQEILQESQEEAKANQITVKIENNIKKDIFYLDRPKIRKVFKVLVDNAIKYSRVGGKVLIKINLENNINKELAVSVTDSGIGVNENQQERLFDKFFRSKDATYHAPNGLGLGLYIAKKYIEAHNGEIRFKSILNRGTTFFVNIPFS